MRRALCLTVLLVGALAVPAHAHAERAAGVLRADPAQPCPGAAIEPDRVVTGRFGPKLQGSYVMVPFEVPAGTTAVRVKYCYDQPEAELPAGGHTLDLGLWGPRPSGGDWGEEQFRGWGGSSHRDVIVSPQGFSSEEAYREAPRANVGWHTTRGFRPGPIAAGAWAVELGVAGVAPPEQGDAGDGVGWRVEIDLSQDPAALENPYVPAPYDATPARPGAGWYAGDMHVHAEHSSLGDATMRETFAYAFRPLERDGAGLDFVTLSDYVTDSAWGEIGRFQDEHPDHLVVRSSEVITYRGHLNNHASLRYVDHRTGPVLERRDDGSLRPLRGATSADGRFADILGAGGWTQINHPTIFPSAVPGFAQLCRGCPWDYASTDWRRVDAIEVATGPGGLEQQPRPGPNPFTPLAIDFYERALATGARIAAVGSSDSHHAGRTPSPVTQAPIGEATTVVYADELSEDGIRRAVKARHTYVKVLGNAGPDLRLEAVAPGHDGPPAIMGDVLGARSAKLTARVTGADPARGLRLVWLRDGRPVRVDAVTAGDQTFRHDATAPGRYRIQLMRASAIEALTSPVWLDPGAPASVNAVGLGGGRTLRSRRTARTVRVRCAARGHALERCEARLLARPRGGRVRTIARGSAPLRGGVATVDMELTRSGRALVRRRPDGFPATAQLRATGPRGNVGPERRRVRVVARR